MTIKPLADRVVIKLVAAEEKTKSGLILTASAQEKPQIAEVVAVGPGGIVDGNEINMVVKVGDKVIIMAYAQLTQDEDDNHHTGVVFVNDKN